MSKAPESDRDADGVPRSAEFGYAVYWELQTLSSIAFLAGLAAALWAPFSAHHHWYQPIPAFAYDFVLRKMAGGWLDHYVASIAHLYVRSQAAARRTDPARVARVAADMQPAGRPALMEHFAFPPATAFEWVFFVLRRAGSLLVLFVIVSWSLSQWPSLGLSCLLLVGGVVVMVVTNQSSRTLELRRALRRWAGVVMSDPEAALAINEMLRARGIPSEHPHAWLQREFLRLLALRIHPDHLDPRESAATLEQRGRS